MHGQEYILDCGHFEYLRHVKGRATWQDKLELRGALKYRYCFIQVGCKRRTLHTDVHPRMCGLATGCKACTVPL